MTNMLRALIDTIDSLQEQMGTISKDVNPKKELKRNARDKKTPKQK